MQILDFLEQLDRNLTNSIKNFHSLNKTTVSDLEKMHMLIQKNSEQMYKYLEYLKQLEILHFTNDNNFVEEEQFIHSFNIDPEIYTKNYKKRFKDDMKANVNIHKLKANRKKSKSDIAKAAEKPTKIKDVTDVINVNITPNKLQIPVVTDLKNIQPMFHWYEGDAQYPKGVYVCMSTGFYVKIALPETISTVDHNFKVNSIPCKYETRDACTKNKIKISEIYNSEIRECTYVHRNETFNKIGSFYKCNIEGFGNHARLCEDLKIINIDDIKRILMYSLSDSLLSVIWYQNYNSSPLVLGNIDKF